MILTSASTVSAEWRGAVAGGGQEKISTSLTPETEKGKRREEEVEEGKKGKSSKGDRNRGTADDAMNKVNASRGKRQSIQASSY